MLRSNQYSKIMILFDTEEKINSGTDYTERLLNIATRVIVFTKLCIRYQQNKQAISMCLTLKVQLFYFQMTVTLFSLYKSSHAVKRFYFALLKVRFILLRKQQTVMAKCQILFLQNNIHNIVSINYVTKL